MTEAVHAYVSIGSNIDPEQNVAAALQQLDTQFGNLQASRVFRTAAVGFVGPAFLNLAVRFETRHSIEDVVVMLRAIEDACGRTRDAAKFSSRTLDLDLLLYGPDTIRDRAPRLPRSELAEQAFVLAPMADLEPSLRHPTLGQTMAELWEAYPDPPAMEVVEI